MTYFPKTQISYNDDLSFDAFGRARVSQNNILLSSYFNYDKLPLVWDEEITGGASSTHDSNTSCVQMTVGTASGDKVVRQTKEYFLYRSGQAQYIRMTASGLDQETNVRKRVGYFDDYNGLFLEVTDSDIAFVLRSYTSGTAVDTRITQSNWNKDSLDGNGSSGITIDWTKAQHLYIDLQWLGVGRVRFAMHVGGIDILAHEIYNANILDTVYMSRASLPIRYEIENLDTSAGSTLNQLCQAVTREGGSENEGVLNFVDTSVTTPSTATSTARTILSIDLRSTSVRGSLKPTNAFFGALEEGVIKYFVVLNPTLGGALTFANTGQISRVSTTQVTYSGGGQVLGGGFNYLDAGFGGSFGSQGSLQLSLDSILKVLSNIDETSDVLSIVVQSSTAGPINCWAGLQYLELY